MGVVAAVVVHWVPAQVVARPQAAMVAILVAGSLQVEMAVRLAILVTPACSAAAALAGL